MLTVLHPSLSFLERTGSSERAGRLTRFAVVALLSLALWAAIGGGLAAVWP
jgi:hypothetical protein